jgi:hypothetical protein
MFGLGEGLTGMELPTLTSVPVSYETYLSEDKKYWITVPPSWAQLAKWEAGHIYDRPFIEAKIMKAAELHNMFFAMPSFPKSERRSETHVGVKTTDDAIGFDVPSVLKDLRPAQYNRLFNAYRGHSDRDDADDRYREFAVVTSHAIRAEIERNSRSIEGMLYDPDVLFNMMSELNGGDTYVERPNFSRFDRVYLPNIKAGSFCYRWMLQVSSRYRSMVYSGLRTLLGRSVIDINEGNESDNLLALLASMNVQVTTFSQRSLFATRLSTETSKTALQDVMTAMLMNDYFYLWPAFLESGDFSLNNVVEAIYWKRFLPISVMSIEGVRLIDNYIYHHYIGALAVAGAGGILPVVAMVPPASPGVFNPKTPNRNLLTEYFQAARRLRPGIPPQRQAAFDAVELALRTVDDPRNGAVGSGWAGAGTQNPRGGRSNINWNSPVAMRELFSSRPLRGYHPFGVINRVEEVPPVQLQRFRQMHAVIYAKLSGRRGNNDSPPPVVHGVLSNDLNDAGFYGYESFMTKVIQSFYMCDLFCPRRDHEFTEPAGAVGLAAAAAGFAAPNTIPVERTPIPLGTSRRTIVSLSSVDFSKATTLYNRDAFLAAGQKNALAFTHMADARAAVEALRVRYPVVDAALRAQLRGNNRTNEMWEKQERTDLWLRIASTISPQAASLSKLLGDIYRVDAHKFRFPSAPSFYTQNQRRYLDWIERSPKFFGYAHNAVYNPTLVGTNHPRCSLVSYGMPRNVLGRLNSAELFNADDDNPRLLNLTIQANNQGDSIILEVPVLLDAPRSAQQLSDSILELSLDDLKRSHKRGDTIKLSMIKLFVITDDVVDQANLSSMAFMDIPITITPLQSPVNVLSHDELAGQLNQDLRRIRVLRFSKLNLVTKLQRYALSS